jgi:hypothetical protein
MRRQGARPGFFKNSDDFTSQCLERVRDMLMVKALHKFRDQNIAKYLGDICCKVWRQYQYRHSCIYLDDRDILPD